MPPRSNSSESLFSVMYDNQWHEQSEVNESESDIDSESFNVKSVVTPKSRGSSRTVTICETTTIFLVEHINDLTEEEINSVWYNKNDFDTMKQEIAKTVQLMESGERLSEHEQTIRGLEYRTRAGAWLKFQNKRAAYCAVLDEQDRQWDEEINDWNAISKVYIHHSERCAQAAVQVAHRDEVQARRIYGAQPDRKVRTNRPISRIRRRTRNLAEDKNLLLV